jgi:O-antigen ligase
VSASTLHTSGRSALSMHLTRAADVLALALVATLPYSVSATSILVPLWIVALAPTLSRGELLRELAAPRSAVPVALALLLVLGLAWGQGTGREGLAAAGALLKLLVLPLLFLQFRRGGPAAGGRAARLFVAALVPILLLSFATLIWPQGLLNASHRPDVPFKDYIAQSGFFAFAAYLLAHAALDSWRSGQRWRAVGAVLLAAAFLANIVFIVTARTTLVMIPALALVFIAQRFGLRAGLALVAAGALAAGLAWSASPQLRQRALAVGTELGDWQASGAVTSSGLRAEWWQRSLGFMAERPLTGHGTGSIPSLFRRVATGEFVATQPHNQILTVGLQVGAIGIVLLLATWAVHAGLFLRAGGLAGMIGAALVLQNVVSSQFNSHLGDFTQGWAYVIGVGICGGVALARRDPPA